MKVPGFLHERAKRARTHDWKLQTHHLTLTFLRQLGVARSSPCTLTTSLSIPIPSSSQGLRKDPATNAVDNQGQALAAPCLGRSKVRSASLVRDMNDDMIFWVLWSQCVKSSATHDLRKATLVCFWKKEEKNPKEKVPALFAFESYLTGWWRD